MSSSSSRKSARIFSQSRLLTPTLILWIRMMVGSGRKKRKEEKKRDRPYLLLDMGQGPYVVGSQKRRKAARKRPHRCYIHIHQIKSHISTRFFLVQMAPRFVEATYGIPGYILVPIKPVPSSQHAIVADARFSSPLLPPIKHTCELSSPFTEHSRLSESRSHAIPA